MGSPISGTMAEIFLQYIENEHIKQSPDTKNIILYTRYVDDILTIYDNTRTTADDIHNHINNTHKSLQFSPTPENKKQVNFLDLNITRKENKLEIGIYCKPTTKDTTINYISNHPHGTQTRGIQVPHQQNARTTTDKRKKTTRMEHNTKYGTQQQLSQRTNNKTKTTNGTEHKETTTGQEREHKQEMGNLYLLYPSNKENNKSLQTHGHQDLLQN
jgi:hypothetical protein